MKKNVLRFLLLVPLMMVVLISSCEEDVKPAQILLDGIVLNSSTLSMKVNETHTLVVSLTPESLTEKITPVWVSSNPRVASVVAGSLGINATLTALSPGSVIITASNADGSISAETKVDVSHVNLESISLNESSLNLSVGDAGELIASITPEKITEDFEAVWTSSDEVILKVTVDEENPMRVSLSAISVGSAIVTVANSSGEISATASIQVRGIPLQGLSINLRSETSTEKVYELTFMPADASNKNVTWTSSDVAVATVADGTISLVGVGSTIVRVTSQDGSFTKEVNLNVSWDGKFDNYCAVNGGATTYYPATVTTSSATTDLNYTGVLPTDNYDYHTAGRIGVAQGGSFNLTITQAVSHALTLVYFDWNADGIWDVGTTEEGILFGAASAGTMNGDPLLSKLINVPAGAVRGTTRMRVTTVDAWTTDISTTIAPCGAAGEIRNSSSVDFDLEIL